jgi:hypothetical protein
MRIMGRKVRTLQLEQHALAGRDLCASLAHPLECQRYLLLVAARHAVCENVHVIAVLEKVQGGLQHADMRLHSDISGDSIFGLRSQDDAPRCP